MICQRSSCGKPVPDGRRKYCCDRCGRIVNRDSSTARARRRTAAIEARGGPQVAARICLSCDRPFLSEGPWNRICPRCGERNVGAPPRASGAHIGAPFSLFEIRRLVEDY